MNKCKDGFIEGTGENARVSSIGSTGIVLNREWLNNAAVGYTSLMSNVTGADNIAFGPASLGRNTPGANNVALGNLIGEY